MIEIDNNEEIKRIVHKHWFLGLKALFWPTLLFIAVWLVLYEMPNRYMFYTVALAAVAVLIWWIRNFMDYYLDVWLITNKGVIDLEWHGWFHRSSVRILYSDIEAVSYEIVGIVGTLLNYGTIQLEKISTGGAVIMSNVSRPKLVERVVMESMEKYIHSKNLKDAKTVQTILAEFVAGTMQKKKM